MRFRAAGLLIASAIALFSTACGRRQDDAKEKLAPIPNLKIEKVIVAPIDNFYEATGTVSSKTTSVVSSRIMGSIIVIHVREGDRVFDEVQAKYKVADAEAERATRMLSSLEARKKQVLAKIDQAKADVANAQVYASYGRVASPMNGIVTAKQAEVGAMAAPGARLLTLEDDSHYRLEASVEESQIRSIQMSDQVRVRIDALGDEELSGRVSEIVPAADPSNRSNTVKIDLLGQRAIRSGSFGRARFSSGQKQAITIPQRAITERGQLVSVFVVDDSGMARLRLIKTGKAYGDRVEVLTGLSDGERIVIDGVEDVSDGSRVESI